MTTLVTTDRLFVRTWEPGDAAAALAVFGDERVARWLAPAREPVADEAAMSAEMERWAAESGDVESTTGRFAGRWALARREDEKVVGALVLRTMPPHNEDLEIAWQLAPEFWGSGFALEAARALAQWAFEQSVAEVFAVVRPDNDRADSVARRLGMEWVGETDKYYDLPLSVYRLRPADLPAAAGATA